MNNKLIIWALYDDAESSYKNTIEKHYDKNFIIYSIGINNVIFEKSNYFFYKKIDLSLINFNLIKQLKELPHPDIILASPPCESWSGADCGGVMFKSIKNHTWTIMNKNYYDKYNQKCHPVKRRYFEQKETGRIIGETTIGATIKIIQYFNPKIWVIENPLTSKTWAFQKEHWNFEGTLNKTYYSAYDSTFSKKPTIFKSNIKLNLKLDSIKGNKSHMAFGNYSKRSSIPEKLIQEIIEQISCNEIIANYKENNDNSRQN